MGNQAWQRQKNGNGLYHEITDQILSLEGTIAVAGSGFNWVIPWGVDGFRRGVMILPMQNATGPWSFNISVQPIGSESVAGAEVKPFGDIPVNAMDVTGQITVANSGDMVLIFTFDDSPAPGNLYMRDNTGAIVSRGNVLNPVGFMNASNLKFRLLATVGNADPITVLANPSAILSG